MGLRLNKTKSQYAGVPTYLSMDNLSLVTPWIHRFAKPTGLTLHKFAVVTSWLHHFVNPTRLAGLMVCNVTFDCD